MNKWINLLKQNLDCRPVLKVMTPRTLRWTQLSWKRSGLIKAILECLGTARGDTASIAMDPNTDKSRLEQGQPGLLGSAHNNAVCIVIEPENMDETRSDHGQSGALSTARVETAHTAMEPAWIDETRPDEDQSGALSTVCDNTMNIVMGTANHGMEVETPASPAALLDGFAAPLPTPSTPLVRERFRSPRLRGEALSALVLRTSHNNTGFATGRCGAGDVEVGRRAVDGPQG